MLLIPNAVFTEYVAHLTKRGIPVDRFSEYKKWLQQNSLPVYFMIDG